MKHRTIGELIFWGTLACALVFYGETAPQGLPWNDATTFSNPIWQYLVAMAGGRVILLSSFTAAVAGGLLGALINRYFGWRWGAAAAVIFVTMPGVWNGAITGSRGVVASSAVIGALWVLNAVALYLFRNVRKTKKKDTRQGLQSVLGAHVEAEKREMINRIVGWVILGVAGLFAIVSAATHDYQLGEAASKYAKLIVEEADGRVILMNGLCDKQIEYAVKAEEVKGERVHEEWRTISFHATDANRKELVSWVKYYWPTETNLWLRAEISPETFAAAAVEAHPDRFYQMNGKSTTVKKWEARWKKMKPYLKSRDKFIPAMRRAFAYEGNELGNRLLQGLGEASQADEGKVKKQAWNIYLSIFSEIEPLNPAACINLNSMLRNGYKVDALTRRRVESAQKDYAKIVKDKAKAVQFAKRVAQFGPVMRDEKAFEELLKRARQNMEELKKKGEKTVTIPDLKTLEEWHSEMMKSFHKREFEKAARIARAILSRPAWFGFVPAYMVLGEKMMMEENWVAAESFLRVAVEATGIAAPPPLVLNDYAETLRQLTRYAEAEKYARKAVQLTTAQEGWVYRLTLVQILKAQGEKARAAEIKALMKEVQHDAPTQAREMIQKEFAQ